LPITSSNWEISQDTLNGDPETLLTAHTRDDLCWTRKSSVSDLISVLRLKDFATHAHSRRSAHWAARLCVQLGLGTGYQDDVETATLLHDVGKIEIPDTILTKPGPLTPEERLIINKHAEYGWNILRGNPEFERVSLFVLHHHERIDGKGYPHGLRGELIPLGARIVSVIDAFDAMTSARYCRNALPLEEAVRRLKAGSGTQFDSRILNQFVRMIGSELPRLSCLN
jgi:putative nucleotidyltransferase with HDIG domain